MPSDSSTGTLKSMPSADSLPTHGAVMMCDGYVYFGRVLRSPLTNSSMPSWTMACSLGAERKRMRLSSRFVRKDVFTLAPFS